MTDTLNTVYQAIKELSADNLDNNEITRISIAKHTGLLEHEVLLAVRELHKAGKVKIDDILPSTGKSDYGEILEFAGIEVV